MNDEYPDGKQRFAVCNSLWKEEDAMKNELRKAIPSHKTPTSTDPWDGPANEAKLKSGQPREYYEKAYAWRDPDKDETVKAAYKFPHHEVSSDGTPGAANVKGCQAGIGVLNGGRGGADIPDADRKGVWNHFAAHLRDADVEPAPLRSLQGSGIDSAERKVEIRTYPVELRVEPDGDTVKIKGHAAVFNKWSLPIGGGFFEPFKEKILPGAFKKALEKSDIRMLWNHNADIVLGRQSAGTLTVQEDDKGLYVEGTPPSWAENYLETIKRGDVSEMSFAFLVAEGGDEFDKDKGERTISEIEDVFDVSPVTYPAYPQTSVKVRMAECDMESIRATVSEEIQRYLHQPEALDGQGAPPQEGHIGRLAIEKKRLDLIEKI